MITFNQLQEKIKQEKNVKMVKIRLKNKWDPDKDDPIQTPGTNAQSVTGLGMIWPDTFRGK